MHADKPMRFEKSSSEYAQLANDFGAHRFFHWPSVWYQAGVPIIDESVGSVLEFGPGRGVSKALMEHFGIRHIGVDVNPFYAPDVLSTISEYSTEERFDLVCAFEVLEHNPLEELKPNLEKFASLSKRYVFISVPFSGRWVSLTVSVNLPRLNVQKKLALIRERRRKVKRPVETFRNSSDPFRHHWWEVGDKEISKRAMRGLISSCGLRVDSEFHSPLFPHHLFYLLSLDASG